MMRLDTFGELDSRCPEVVADFDEDFKFARFRKTGIVSSADDLFVEKTIGIFTYRYFTD